MTETKTKRATLTIRCPRCNSTLVYYRLITEDFVCRHCGNYWKA